jgi:beta-lactam-binding protein with PASTA domain
MPNLVGTNLQEAQDRIQTLTSNAIFVTTSHDETGAGRQQVLDRNWKVCSQNVKPGQKIIASTQIDFGAVKTTESC